MGNNLLRIAFGNKTQLKITIYGLPVKSVVNNLLSLGPHLIIVILATPIKVM